MSTISNSNVRGYNTEAGSFNPYRDIPSYGRAVGHKLPVKVPKHKTIVSKRELNFLRAGMLVTTLSLIGALAMMLNMVKISDASYRERMMLKNSPSSQVMRMELANVTGDMATFVSDNHTFITQIPTETVNYLSIGTNYEVIYDNGKLTTVTKINK